MGASKYKTGPARRFESYAWRKSEGGGCGAARLNMPLVPGIDDAVRQPDSGVVRHWMRSFVTPSADRDSLAATIPLSESPVRSLAGSRVAKALGDGLRFLTCQLRNRHCGRRPQRARQLNATIVSGYGATHAGPNVAASHFHAFVPHNTW